MRWSLVLSAALTLFPGCAKQTPGSNAALGQQDQPAFEGAPDWVTNGCMDGDRSSTAPAPICAVGAVEGVSNVAMAGDAAANRARVELSRQIETRMASVIGEFQSTATGDGPLSDAMSDPQFITNTSKSISQSAVSGAEIQDRWISETGAVWVLVAVDHAHLLQVLTQASDLPPSLKAHLLGTADHPMAGAE